MSCSLRRRADVLVGSDLSGLELRCLAHFMNDGGKFAKELLEGDIHEQIWLPLELPIATRASDSRMPHYMAPASASSEKSSAEHPQTDADCETTSCEPRQLTLPFLRAVKAAVDTKGHLVGLDFRKLPSAANTLP